MASLKRPDTVGINKHTVVKCACYSNVFNGPQRQASAKWTPSRPATHQCGLLHTLQAKTAELTLVFSLDIEVNDCVIQKLLWFEPLDVLLCDCDSIWIILRKRKHLKSLNWLSKPAVVYRKQIGNITFNQPYLSLGWFVTKRTTDDRHLSLENKTKVQNHITMHISTQISKTFQMVLNPIICCTHSSILLLYKGQKGYSRCYWSSVPR